MDIKTYLPDALGERAKERGLNLSRLLRDAVTKELETMDTMEKTLTGLREIEIEVQSRDGDYIGRFVGREIAYSDREEVAVFLTEDQRVILYHSGNRDYRVLENPVQDLRDQLTPELYADAMRALGERPVIDI
jgi:hypothetical protein